MLSDEEVMLLVSSKELPAYKLEAMLGDHERGVAIRSVMQLYLSCVIGTLLVGLL